jgi:hypothetical protein
MVAGVWALNGVNSPTIYIFLNEDPAKIADPGLIED